MSDTHGACNGGPGNGSTVAKQRWVPIPEPGTVATHWWHLA